MLVIAHRGASRDLPENTLPAFERAIELGADYVEFDVHNDLSVTHDAPRRGVAYPTLAEVLDLCHGRIGVMVELKRPRGDTVQRALALMHGDDVLVCFQRRAIEEARVLPARAPHGAARRLRRLDPPGRRRVGGRLPERARDPPRARRRHAGSGSRRPSTR